MNKLMKIAISLLVAFAIASPLVAAPTAVSLMQKLDSMMEQQSNITATVTILQERVKQGKKVIKSYYYRDDTRDSFLILILEPTVEKGNGYLRQGDNFWMYRKNTGSFQKITRDESISGSDIKGGDVEQTKLMEQYAPATGVTSEKLGKIDCWKFEMKAKIQDVTYPKQVYWVEKSTGLPRKVQSYALSGKLMQTALYYQYSKVGGSYVLKLAKFIDEFEKGNSSVLQITKINTAPIDPQVFTKGYLKSLSQ